MNYEPNSRKALVAGALFSGLSSLSDLAYFVLLVFAGRLVGAEEFGIFNSGLAYTSITAYLLNLGLDSIAIQKIAAKETKANKIVGNIILWKTFLSVIVFLLFLAGMQLFLEDEVWYLVFLFLLQAAIFRSFNLTMRAFLRAHEKFHIEWLVVLFERVSILVVGLGLLIIFENVVYLAASFAACRLLTLIIYQYVIGKSTVEIDWSIDFTFLKKLQFEAIPIGIATIVFGVYLQIDIIILTLLESNHEIGLFGAIYKIFEGLLALSILGANVIYPRLSKYYVTNHFKHRDLFFRSIKYMVIIGSPILVSGFAYSSLIVSTLYGSEFAAAEKILPFISSALFLMFIISSFTTVFKSRGNNIFVLQIMSIGLALKIILDFLLIPELGISGAGIAVLSSTLAMLVMSLFIFAKKLPDLMLSWQNEVFLNFRVVLAAVITLVTFFAIDYDSVLVLVIVYSIIYPILLILFKCIDKYEIEAITPKYFR